MIRPKAVQKTLSVNDAGSNGSHQAGMLIPKSGDILLFFPMLNPSIKNPRCTIRFVDDLGKGWDFNFIYYNNKLNDPNGTRNEYRLTGMTAYIRENNLKPDDRIVLKRSDDDEYSIGYERHRGPLVEEMVDDGIKRVRISLSHSWTVVELRGD